MSRTSTSGFTSPAARAMRFGLRFASMWLALFAWSGAGAVNLQVQYVDDAGVAHALTSYRFLVEEDRTYDIRPGITCKPDLAGGIDDCLSLNFHRSYMPVILSGASWNPDDVARLAALPSDRRYFLSVLPGHSDDAGSGYQVGGTPIAVGQTDATVQVIPHLIPTAQIRVFTFLDNWPINNAPDSLTEIPAPGETSPMAGWRVLLDEPAGRYGIPGGQVSQDAFGNPLGTTYVPGSPGTVLELGTGTIKVDDRGVARIKNIPPGKYGIQVVPPEGQGWFQTTTIEGTHTIDAWVKANEPPLLVEFGPPVPHVFMGFVRQQGLCFDPDGDGVCGPDGTGTIQGQVRAMHLARPPEVGFFPGRLLPNCLVALNDQANGGKGVGMTECDEDSRFRFDGVPAGTYQLVIWDKALDYIINLSIVTIGEGETLNYVAQTEDPTGLGTLNVFPWFGRTEFWVFDDKDADGFRDCFSPACDGTDPRDEIGIPEQNINIRFRDGTIFQAFPTDRDGYVPFDEIFPFFNWQIAEVDFLRFKATGGTFVVDAGGPVNLQNEAQGENPGPPFDWADPGRGFLTPQPQCGDGSGPGGSYDTTTGACLENAASVNPNTGNNLSRTEAGVVLLEAFGNFAGNTNVMEFGKARYGRGENGGVSGIVFYGVTRAEDDPAYAVAEEWEPGIADIQVSLYRDHDRDNVIDDMDGDGVSESSDIDNYPFGWRDGTAARGPEDFDLDDPDHTLVADDIAVFDYGDAINVVRTDSFDANPPTGCQGDTFYVCPSTHPRNAPCTAASPGAVATDCYDNLRSYNQVRPGVFDGGYAFESEWARDANGAPLFVDGEPVEISSCAGSWPVVYCETAADCAGGQACVPASLRSDTYIVEVGGQETGRHPVYKTIREEDRNVDFGDEYSVSELLLPPPCVGVRPGPVPDKFSLFDLGEPPFRSGQTPPLCDRKQVQVKSGFNAAADFHKWTDAPISAHIAGFMNNDLGNERNPQSPLFAEKFAPPYVPITVLDWKGDRITQVYSDQYGRYNILVPSSFNANLPMPSGWSPNMLIICINDPSWAPNPDFQPDPALPLYDPRQLAPDPFYDARFSRTCYTFPFMPGTTTYLDTPLIPVSAFAETDVFPVDCEYPTGTPGIHSVNNISNGAKSGPDADRGDSLEVLSLGVVEVPDPRYNGQGTVTTILRNYGFDGARGAVWAIDPEATGGAPYRYPLIIESWTGNRIQAHVPTQAEITPGSQCENRFGGSVPCGTFPARGQLVIEKANGVESEVGVTLHVGGGETRLHVPADYPTIQAAIEAAAPGDLVLVAPGVYDELVVLWKPLQLQGWGAGSTVINAIKSPAERLVQWQNRTNALIQGSFPGDPPGNCNFGGGSTSCVDLLAGQVAGVNLFLDAETDIISPLLNEEGPGIIVLGKNVAPAAGGFGAQWNPRIDGLTIFGATQGGGILVNAYNHDLQITNNRITGNEGTYGGGVRIGHPYVYDPVTGEYPTQINQRIRIAHNQIVKNGGRGGFGAGVSIQHGSDDYEVAENFVCGNFGVGSGGGIGHYGESDGGRIAENLVTFNQVFNQMLAADGGGIFVGGGAAPAAGAPGTPVGATLGTPSGNVVIEGNRLVGNHAGSGSGAGIALRNVNGRDIGDNPGDRGSWSSVGIYDNEITNNVAAYGGGGISLQDAALVDIHNNTISRNDATATAQQAFAAGNTMRSLPGPAGIQSFPHSPLLAGAFQPGPDQDQLGSFSQPDLVNNVVLGNRTFFWEVDPVDLNRFGLVPDTSLGGPRQYQDLGVVGLDGAMLDPHFCVLTNQIATFNDAVGAFGAPIAAQAIYGGANNRFAPPGSAVVRRPYENGSSDQVVAGPGSPIGAFSSVPAFDEGGNFIDVRYGPLTLTEPVPGDATAWRQIGDYHLTSCSIAKDAGDMPFSCGPPDARGTFLCRDRDLEIRPQAQTGVDIGADEDYSFCADANAAPAKPGEFGGPASDKPDSDGSTGSAGTDTPVDAGRKRFGNLFDNKATEVGTRNDPGSSAPILDAPLPLGAGPVACSALYPGNTDGFGNTFRPGARCMSLAAGDGFVRMADGRRLYIFSFRNVTGLPFDSADPDVRTVWDEGFLGAEAPAPSIVVDEGDELYLSLTNVGMQIRPDLFDPHSVHYHGFPNASTVYDGVPENSISINMGGTLHYFYKNVHPGTYMYHCHVEATEHMQMGMLGNLYVRPAQNRLPDGTMLGTHMHSNPDFNANRLLDDPLVGDKYAFNDGDGSTRYDVEYPIQIGSFDGAFHDASESVQPLPFAYMRDSYPLLNGRGYPDTVNEGNFPNDADLGGPRESQRLPSLIRATSGQHVLLRVSNLNVTRYYTLRVLGIPMKVVGQDARLRRGPGGADTSYGTDSVTIGGGETRDVILDLTGVPPGTYFAYATQANYLANEDEDYGGMMTEIVVEAP